MVNAFLDKMTPDVAIYRAILALAMGAIIWLATRLWLDMTSINKEE